VRFPLRVGDDERAPAVVFAGASAGLAE